MSLGFHLCPVVFRDARAFINAHHRHHKAPVGWLFGVGVNYDGRLVGVACVGRPVARMLQDGYTAEVTRTCVMEGYNNGCSFLLGACRRAAKALGYKRLITYILDDPGYIQESGVSLRAAGWQPIYNTDGGSWHRTSRPRQDSAPVCRKVRWEVKI